MGANPTQAQAFALFVLAFVLLAAAFATGGSILYIVGFAACLGLSIMLFVKCKPWEHNED